MIEDCEIEKNYFNRNIGNINVRGVIRLFAITNTERNKNDN